MKKDIYQLVTDRIIEGLERGEIAWKRPYTAKQPVNWTTQKPYRGINTLLLDEGEYATFKQIKDAGGKVKKGQKGKQIIFWKLVDGEDKDTGKETKIPLLRTYTVFEVNKQAEGISSKLNGTKMATTEYERHVQAESIINNYPNKPKLIFESGTPCYYPSRDTVKMPNINDFISMETYYSTFFHELIHSTGSKERLNREGIVNLDSFGTKQYSKEELIAEMGANMLCMEVGINTTLTDDNSLAYIQNWIKVLKEDKKFIVTAAQQAQQAVDHILDMTF